ncbi:MAG: hypothetical protein KW788_02035 [Candidatus Doudnabacteria bacterium]|nr:hypothetical protein [Candidatus Doudnabacteria bacterium]
MLFELFVVVLVMNVLAQFAATRSNRTERILGIGAAITLASLLGGVANYMDESRKRSAIIDQLDAMTNQTADVVAVEPIAAKHYVLLRHRILEIDGKKLDLVIGKYMQMQTDQSEWVYALPRWAASGRIVDHGYPYEAGPAKDSR